MFSLKTMFMKEKLSRRISFPKHRNTIATYSTVNEHLY
jgi:hypothetical protein